MNRTFSFLLLVSLTVPVLASGNRFVFLDSDGVHERFLDTRTGETLLRDIDFRRAARGVQSTLWLQSRQVGDLVYFLFTEPGHIKRYDLQSGTWLADILLPETPTAFAVTGEQLSVAFGRRIARFDLSGRGETHLRNTVNDVYGLTPFGRFLLVQTSAGMQSIDALTGGLIDESNFWYRLGELAVRADGVGFGRSLGTSPSDIVRFEIGSDGVFGNQNDSPYHGGFPGAQWVRLLPDQARVVDNGGTVYHADDLVYATSVAGHFDDIAFYGNVPIILRDNHLIAFNRTLLETGRLEVAESLLKIAVVGETVVGFYEGTDGPETAVYAIEQLQPETPGAAVNPVGLAYTPDAVIMDRAGVLNLLSRAHLSVFRWSVAEQRYLDTIPLVNGPHYMTYSEATHALFFAYNSGALTRLDLDGDRREVPFANLPTAPLGLAAADQHIFACDSSGAWASHRLFNLAGELTEYVDWNHSSVEFIWSQPLRRMFFFGFGDLMYEEISTAGRIVDRGEAPYSNDTRVDYPIRVSPDGAYIVLGTGVIYSGADLARTNTLSNEIEDAAWFDGRLFTLHNLGGVTQLQEWGAGNFPILARLSYYGTPLRLFAAAGGLQVITMVDEVPVFSLYQPACAADPLPTVSTLPAEVEVCEGGETTLSLAVLEGEVTAWQWRFNGLPIAGADAADYTLPATGEAMLGAYDCLITSCNGSFLSSTATVRMGTTVYDDTAFAWWPNLPNSACYDTNQNSLTDVLDLVAMVNLGVPR
ncbi:hypothetical protein [Acanthopleuribacter pedis]|uniref:Ig-like domain-containing protein n=1 Tax=Acanthopleuribacter pedis TaxID=442870 RepID=A0A8J7Q616_9BACT|nr:hypothetical protein [Acanthopleuribacter pedis]MBO1321142.1 hypothetical protein [Acanthopleuribacter pedis]